MAMCNAAVLQKAAELTQFNWLSQMSFGSCKAVYPYCIKFVSQSGLAQIIFFMYI
jgi:hypothetical protein